ncbi:MAG: hypothetical protein K2P70_11330 [Hyphomonadaceae bacterium]|nr:hypothetical protein [Hyphomonadaceae bacterium]
MAKRFEAEVEIGITLVVIAALALMTWVLGADGWLAREFCGAEPVTQGADASRYLDYLRCEEIVSGRYWLGACVVAAIATGWLLRRESNSAV